MSIQRILRLLAAVSLAVCAVPAQAATYLPLSDTDLARRSPEIVRARVLDQVVISEVIDGEDLPFTIVRLRAEEVLKGSVPEVFSLRLPGGTIGDKAWRIPGTPAFALNQEVIVFIHPLADRVTYGLTEFGLSKFDVLEDSLGQRFAVRAVFDSATDDFLAGRSEAEFPLQPKITYRDAGSFLQTLRAAVVARSVPTLYRAPQGSLRGPENGLRPQWENLGGREPGACTDGSPCLFRWFWDTGASPIGAVSTTGIQTNLTDGSNGLAHVQNAISRWTTVAASDVRYTGTSGAGNVVVHLDVVNPLQGYWHDNLDTGAIGCRGGTVGLASAWGARGYTFRGEAPYVALTRGEVWMRRSTCGSGYSAATFRTAVLHELGHTLGLGHPDEGQSIHSTTTFADWNSAVMRSIFPAALPDTPQKDDIQGIQYYYGAQSAPPPPPPPPPPTGCVATSSALCLNGRFRAEISRGRGRGSAAMAIPLSADTGYFWFFTSNNVEVVVKVVDGRSLNRSHWVFYGGLSDVDYTLTVTDTATGNVKVYLNEQGTLASVADTSAFPEERGRKMTVSKASVDAAAHLFSLPSRVESKSAAPDTSTACAPTTSNLCLNATRFRVDVTWRTSSGSSGVATAIPLTSDTGYFWFFSPGNVELVLKVVDGRAVNGRFWVFYGALSDVQYTVTIRDTLNQTSRTYSNPQGRLASIADTAAF